MDLCGIEPPHARCKREEMFLGGKINDIYLRLSNSIASKPNAEVISTNFLSGPVSL